MSNVALSVSWNSAAQQTIIGPGATSNDVNLSSVSITNNSAGALSYQVAALVRGSISDAQVVILDVIIPANSSQYFLIPFRSTGYLESGAIYITSSAAGASKCTIIYSLNATYNEPMGT